MAIAWAFCLASFFVATESTPAALGRIVFWLMGAAHLVECAVFFPRLRQAPGALAEHLIQTFLFGIVHVRSLPRSPGAQASIP